VIGSIPKLCDDNGQIIEINKSEKWFYNIWSETYDSILFWDKRYLIDYSRVLLFFLRFVDDKMKKRQKMWRNYLDKYLWPNDNFLNFELKL
jgi:hypothetical protein